MNKSYNLILVISLLTALITSSCSSALTTASSQTTVTTSSAQTTVLSPTSTTTMTANQIYPEQLNTLLALILKEDYTNGGYTVINPQTSLGFGTTREKLITDAAEFQRSTSFDFTNLAGQLYDLNQQFSYLTLPSSIQDGYYVDYNGKFEQYFAKDGGGWDLWHKEHPEAHGSTSVSLPAYDPQTGYILIYIGNQNGWLAGYGGLYAYQLLNGNLILVDHWDMWVS